MNTPTKYWTWTAAALQLGSAPAWAQQEDPRPEGVPATPLIKPTPQQEGEAKPKATAASPSMDPAAAQAQGAVGEQEAGAFDVLDEEYAAAYRAWREKVMELRGTGEEYPPAPLADYYPRFRALADGGDVDARLWCFNNFLNGDTTPEEYRAWTWKGEAYSLATASRENPEIAKRMLAGIYGGTRVEGVGEDGVDEVLLYMLGTIADDNVGAAICYLRARNAEYSRDPERSKQAGALYAALIDRYPTSPEAQRAKGKVFAAENLQLGMVAPDFTGKDVDGKAISLSDYHGKVVVVDFWGFW